MKNHKNYTWENIPYDVKPFQINITHPLASIKQKIDIIYQKLYIKILFLIEIGFVGTTSNVDLIGNYISFHFISFICWSFAFTAALKKRGLEKKNIISNWKIQKKLIFLPSQNQITFYWNSQILALSIVKEKSEKFFKSSFSHVLEPVVL